LHDDEVFLEKWQMERERHHPGYAPLLEGSLRSLRDIRSGVGCADGSLGRDPS
jgi:hypothetical protein